MISGEQRREKSYNEKRRKKQNSSESIVPCLVNARHDVAFLMKSDGTKHSHSNVNLLISVDSSRNDTRTCN